MRESGGNCEDKACFKAIGTTEYPAVKIERVGVIIARWEFLLKMMEMSFSQAVLLGLFMCLDRSCK